MPVSKGESIVIIAIAICHLIAFITSINIAIDDETAAAVATQSAWDLFDSSGAGRTISRLSTATDKKTTQFTWQATADALIDVTRNSMPKFFGGALQDNSSVYSTIDRGALGFDQIHPLHVVSQAVRLVQHRSTPRICSNDLLTVAGPSFFGFDTTSGASSLCPRTTFNSATRTPDRCCIKDFTSSELDTEGDLNSFVTTNSSTASPSTFRRVEADSSTLFSGSGVASALRPDSIYYPFTGFSLDTRYSSDLQTVVLSSDGVPLANTNLNLFGDDALDARFRDFVDPQTRYIRLSILTIYWSAAVAVHLHVHIELPASGAGVAAWRKASAVNIRPGLFGSASATFENSPSAANFQSSSGVVIAEVFALLSSIVFVILVFLRYKVFFTRDPKIPLYVNARFLLDVTAALVLAVYFILRLIIGFQTSSFAEALATANTYESTPISRSSDFISGSWTRFLESLRGGCDCMAFFIALLWPIRYLGVIFQTIRRSINARTLGGVAEITEDSRTGSATAELLPAVLKRFFVDVFRVMTWCMAPLFILCALALSVLRGPDSFYYSYSGSALGTLARDRVLNLFAGFLVNSQHSSYWSHAASGSYWMDLLVGTIIETMVPLVFFAGLLFLGVRSCQEDVYAGKGKSAYFHHEDEEEARILQLQLFPKKPGIGSLIANSQTSDQRKMELESEKKKDQQQQQNNNGGTNNNNLDEALLPKEENSSDEATTSKVPVDENDDDENEEDEIAEFKKTQQKKEQLQQQKQQQQLQDQQKSTDEPYAWSRYGSTQQLANDAAKRKLMEQLRLLSENLRHRIGLVPPKKKQQNHQNPKQELINQQQKRVHFSKDDIITNNNNNNGTDESSSDPYVQYPTARDVSREAAIERLLKARREAAKRGRHLTAEEELAALKGEQPKSVQSAITRVADMYEDLMTLLTAGKTIRDALVNDTKKTVDELEAEMEKVMPKKKVIEHVEEPESSDDDGSTSNNKNKPSSVSVEEVEGEEENKPDADLDDAVGVMNSNKDHAEL